MPGGTQTTQTTSEPWRGQRPGLNLVMRDARQEYKQGPYKGSMYVPFSQQSKDAFKDLSGVAGANSGGAGLSGNLQSIIDGGGFNSQQQSALGNWQNTANSNYDFNANPGSKGVLDAILRDTTDAVNLNAAAAGRYGSGIHQGRLAQDVSDASSQFRMNDYNSWLGRKDAANTNLFNAAQSGLGNMTSAYQGLQAPAQTRLGVGSAMEDATRRKLDEKARVANLDWENIQKLLAATSGAGNYGTSTAVGPGPNPFLQGLGMVGTGGNLLFGTNPMASGGLLGLL
jgi:hypothetical protein